MRSDLAGRIFRQLLSFTVSLLMTFLGLTAVTFLIGRLTRIDPVLAVVGDKASKEVYDQAFKAMGLDSVLVITHELPDNLVLASRNLANVLVVEPRYADPLSLVHYKKVLVTRGAMEQLKEMLT